MEDAIDKRIFERIPCKFVLEIKDTSIKSFQNAKVRNFSGEGIGVKTKRPFLVGTDVDLKLHISKRFSPLSTKARVKWVKKGMFGSWYAGFKFSTFNLLKFAPLMRLN